MDSGINGTGALVCAFLCAQQVAFNVGQNGMVDGGEVNATI